REKLCGDGLAGLCYAVFTTLLFGQNLRYRSKSNSIPFVGFFTEEKLLTHALQGLSKFPKLSLSDITYSKKTTKKHDFPEKALKLIACANLPKQNVSHKNKTPTGSVMHIRTNTLFLLREISYK
ncbi:hypothetical protein, partial [Pseudomonas sp. C1C7]|uniref:hypothetical protein n=1 Tax=Pseudomonas sp. C1C7 TaxID=2735272 RepID=UPI001C49853B